MVYADKTDPSNQFHYPDCPRCKGTLLENRVRLPSDKAALRFGYQPCGDCASATTLKYQKRLMKSDAHAPGAPAPFFCELPFSTIPASKDEPVAIPESNSAPIPEDELLSVPESNSAPPIEVGPVPVAENDPSPEPPQANVIQVSSFIHKHVKRGQIYFADLTGSVGHEQSGVRPVLVVQNDIGNRHSPTVIAVPLTSQIKKSYLPTHVILEAGAGGLPNQSVVLSEQILTLDKCRLQNPLGRLDSSDMQAVDQSLLNSLGLLIQSFPAAQSS